MPKRPPLWREIQRNSFTSHEALGAFLELDLPKTRFPLNVPRRLAEKMAKGDRDDPLFRQFVPLASELEMSSGFTCNPVGDLEARAGAKLLHKYAGRALLLVTSACAMHCRYCFRQHFPYASGTFEEELAYLAAHPTIDEVILSGGDPLSLSNRALADLIGQIEALPHIKRLRFHTRFPIGIPERIDDELIALFHTSRLQPWFVLHTNHPVELDKDVLAYMNRLPVPVLTHTVLLKGVNDSLETLTTLFERLVNHGLTPYYLFQLDRVQGAAHFEVSEQEGKALIDALRNRLPGYALPRYVKELAGEPSKTPIV